ncbi:hypothetical protein CEXT_40791 [Caerostris extrusa]|uniref:Maturase K n=1 Tax=Caerostris extrusa TaxID=172846 RepID=A0AAV4Y493_CAEEX|nr:hypothetical protein CEXT_40791 [Caerostris extrusa]
MGSANTMELQRFFSIRLMGRVLRFFEEHVLICFMHEENERKIYARGSSKAFISPLISRVVKLNLNRRLLNCNTLFARNVLCTAFNSAYFPKVCPLSKKGWISR